METNKTQRNYSNQYVDDYSNFQGQSNSFDLIGWILKMLKYWYLFIIAFVLAAGLAFLKNKTWTPTFKTVSTILIEENNKSGLRNDFGSGYSMVGQGNRNVNNQMIMYGSYDFIAKTVDKMNLTNEIYSKHRFKNIVLYNRTPIKIHSSYIADQAYGLEFEIKGKDQDSYEVLFPGNDRVAAFSVKGRYGEPLQHSLFFLDIRKTNLFTDPKYDLWFHFFSTRQLVGQYKGRLAYRFLMEGASVMEISLLGKVAERDIDFLKLLNKEFFDENLARKNEITERAIEFIDKQLSIIKDSIDSSESKLNTYQMQSGVYSQDKTGNKSKVLDELDQKKAEVRLRKQYMKYLSDYLNQKGNDLLTDPSAMGIINPQLGLLVNQYNSLITEMKTLGPESPIYKRAVINLNDIKKSLREASATMNSTVRLDEDNINQRYSKAMSEISNLPQQERKLLTYERDFKINDSYYSYLLQKRTENQIQKASNTPDNLILDNPRVVSIVNQTDRSNTYILFIAIGLLIPALFVACKEFFFKFSIQSRDEVEKIAHLPILGTIERSTKKMEMVVKMFPKSSFAESFRSLRSRMEYIAKKESPISMLVTSTEPQDGKTFIAINLASIYQITGKKVIIVDFDLRRPALSKAMSIPSSQKGLSNCLVGHVNLDDVIIKHPDYEFDVLPAGVVPPNPSELIRSEETKEILQELYKRYDYVILDCSPVGLVSDAYFLARQVDVVLYVVRNEKTNRNFFKYTIKELQEDAINNIAIVYNDVNTKSSYYGSRRYYGKSSYYLKHGSYYNNNDKIE